MCAKFRSDQLFPTLTLEYMNNFYNQHRWSNNQIFVLGKYKNWPFHPRDHMYWGTTDALMNLFDCPPDLWPYHADYNAILRAEAWLGAHYYAKFDERVKEMLENPTQFLTDNAPERDKALEIEKEWGHKLFYPFPRINYSWPKIGISQYYYDYTATHSEYWHEEIEQGLA